MAVAYRVRVRTGCHPLAGTSDSIAVTLVGTRGTSPRTPLDTWGPDFAPGACSEFRVPCPRALGRLLLVRLHKSPFGGLPESSWLLDTLRVWPEGAEPPPTTPPATPPASPPATPGPAQDDSDSDNDDDDDDDGDDDGASEFSAPRPEDAGDSEEEEEEGDEEEEEEEEDEGDIDLGDIGDGEEEEDDGAEEQAGPFHFPWYRWLVGYGDWDLPEGTAKTLSQERHPLLRRIRRRYLVQQRRRFRLAPYAPGLPWALPFGTPPDPDLCYSLPKATAFYLRGGSALLLSKLQGLLDRPHSWPSVEGMTRLFQCLPCPVIQYVLQHWRDDAFFGAQYLSGVNPVLLRQCRRLPPNFPVTPHMVAPSLGTHTTLQREMEEGNIYLADYGVLDGIPTVLLHGHPSYVAAPMCLLHQRPDGQLLPIAIQLSQHPGPDAPIFLPGDPPGTWLLAKVWVRGAEFQVHEGLTHLLRAHLLGEAFALSTLRRLPPQHPLYKLLLPHTRFTVHVGTLARKFLLNPGGVFDQAVSVGRRGLLRLLSRGLRALRYSALVLPRDIRRRRVTRTRGYHFREDASEIWSAIRSFVRGVVRHYYPGDAAVRGDPELQGWVREIFRRGFLGRRRSGVPSALTSIPQLVTFVTTIIYTCSAHHAATNSGQFELGFPPNMPGVLRAPPPRSKAPRGDAELLQTLPPMDAAARVLAVLWVLRNEPLDMRPLGHYPEQHFTEEQPQRLIGRFQRRLAAISRRIRDRNRRLELPYRYLDPPDVENSVAI